MTFAYIIKRKDEKLDFNNNYKSINNKVRALLNRSYFIIDGLEYKVVKTRFESKKSEIGKINSIYKDGFGIGCNDGEVVILEFIPAGKKQMLVSSYLNGINKDSLLGVVVNEKK